MADVVPPKRKPATNSVIQTGTGKFRETIYINPDQLLVASRNPIEVLTELIIAHANQIGLLGKVILEWEMKDDSVLTHRKKITFTTMEYDAWMKWQTEGGGEPE